MLKRDVMYRGRITGGTCGLLDDNRDESHRNIVSEGDEAKARWNKEQLEKEGGWIANWQDLSLACGMDRDEDKTAGEK